MKEITVYSLKELQEFAFRFASCLKGNEIILLRGNLGSGKTTFVRYLVKSLGGDEFEVTSPTFTIMNEYESKLGVIFHLDLYRVDSFDITDIVGEGIILIEWPKEDYTLYNYPVIELEFSVSEENNRHITIKPLYKSEYILNCV
ncbi:MAG: tRNA (adenosine(37)-N6)-threonylcarbamoyltransferase complex ATPase subunit type 1 TsaE [Aquificae bacterium]|nr:tRNA (adenosine(37)-N6)-threonylcarbamoyltransferase complex ATPase subunit type 1 TsaE [Aquificota bacterium]